MRLANSVLLLWLSVLLGAYSPLGWCPPLPSLSPFPAVLQFGNVVVGDRSQVIVVPVLLSPSACFDGPSCPPIFFGDLPSAASGDSGEFLIDAAHTTCLHGVPMTLTSGCSIGVVFFPHSPGRKVAALDASVFFALGTQFGTTLVLSGFALAAPVPTLDHWALLVLALTICVCVFWTKHREVTRS